MPMRTIDEHGGGQSENACCVHCDEGNLKSRGQVRAGMIALAVRTMGVSEAEAALTVDASMAKMPAWSAIP